jgi:hypothetical protein
MAQNNKYPAAKPLNTTTGSASQAAANSAGGAGIITPGKGYGAPISTGQFPSTNLPSSASPETSAAGTLLGLIDGLGGVKKRGFGFRQSLLSNDEGDERGNSATGARSVLGR